MYRGLRAGNNVWQQLRASGPSCSLQRAAASIATTTGKPRTTITKTITGTGQTRTFASGARDDTTSATEAKTEAEEPPIIFSGIQPTGRPHLGNYLGALKQWKHLQDTAHPDTKLFFCIVDLHAMTTPHARGEMQELKWDMMASLLALGLDPDRCTIFFQSTVPQHAELQWILSCTASTGYLSRMTQWKSKLKLDDNATIETTKGKKTLKHGLFSYPILQAADILLYGTTHVPVGEDQRQHLEFTRECVSNFNYAYKTDLFAAPETLISPFPRIMSLTTPRQKMSKSDSATKSLLHVTSSPKKIIQRISQAVTDGRNEVTYDPENRAGVANLIHLLAGFDPKGRTPEELGETMKGYKISELKQVVIEVLTDELAETRENFVRLSSNKDKLREISAQGTQKARLQAEKIMAKVKDVTGIFE
ncbi:tryptophanyl-tRNA synthetase [Chaetomium tenue]|uniref:Tryptophanyl-tRNA synthetase n=1 Tax=Chaetomium tenue TaxID=1854479 RepID=A0ACB7PFD4_9PEZI|nr:tryptophanyl-tRNA synthetase [Chaetomium globosum]